LRASFNKKKGEGSGAMSRLVREHDRINATIPVQIEGGGEGRTLNLSPHGIFLVTDQDMRVGSSLRFTMEFTSASVSYYLDCIGEIVRIAEVEGKRGVGVSISSSRLQRRTAQMTSSGGALETTAQGA
jgi:hypothetical protein